MATRSIRKEDDEILRKKCKPIDVITSNVKSLIIDMGETMKSLDGMGLAASQIGILKRLVVIDNESEVLVLINPVIISSLGQQLSSEGCLSLPGFCGSVKRPQKVTVEALNEDGMKIIVEGEDILAVILCHEIDHLDGILFKDKAQDYHPIEGKQTSRRNRQ